MAGPFALQLGPTLTRSFTITTAAMAISWTIVVIPSFWSEATVVQAATHIVAGEIYKPDVMDALDAALQSDRASHMRPAIMSKAAVIRLRRSEDAIASADVWAIDASLNSLGRSIDDAVANAPSDSFVWLMLFWLEDKRNKSNPRNVSYLQMSYALGPNEGWMAVKRNRLTMAMFQKLPKNLAEAAVSEFVGLVRSGLYTDVADILAGPGWPVRRELMAHLSDFNPRGRLALAKVLYDRNIRDVSVPGVDLRPPRPWQH